MMSKPVEDFMSEDSVDKEQKYKDDEIVVDLMERNPTEEKTWRICLGTESEEYDKDKNPFFAPWICSGTMKYVHLDWLKEWVHSKRHSKEGVRVKSYNWKFLEWELWKNKIHEKFEFRGKKYYLLEYFRPTEGHYLILESFTNTPHKTIHVIHISEELAKKKRDVLVKVGRGTEVDIRITDISVSRYHSRIYLSKGEFFCIDNYSKFGTVALLRQPISLPQKGEHLFQIQVGKHLIEVESESHLSCCFWNITNRVNKKFKGPSYDEFKHLLPHKMRTKLNLLGNLTNILETQNVEEAEDNLNREITRIKLVHENLLSQRTFQCHPHLCSQEDNDKVFSKPLVTNGNCQQTIGESIDRTRLHMSEIQTLNDIPHTRKVVPWYQDSSLNITNDVNLTLNQNQIGLNTDNSQNILENGINKRTSTKEKLLGQGENIPSGNQFTLDGSEMVHTKIKNNIKSTKISKMLYEEYKHPDTIEEEKKEFPDCFSKKDKILPSIYKDMSSDDEEEKIQVIVMKKHLIIGKDESVFKGGENSKGENSREVSVKSGLYSSKGQHQK